MHTRLFILLLVGLALTGCAPRISPAAAGPPASTPTASRTAPPPGIKTPAPVPSATSRPETPLPTATLLPTAAAPPVFPFARPILPPGRDTVDPTYRFGTTAGGEREPHHGVEFVNSQGTPVAAAADGTVIFAGDDNNGSPFSPRGWYAFYGRFVVVEHDLAGYESPVYTLYAHLSETLVETGEKVEAGQTIGLVGFTGAAVGSHLHFEVRYGGTTYGDVRNPELWLQPLEGTGSLAGAIVDPDGLPLPVVPLQVTALDGTGYTQYFSTYEEPVLAFQPPFSENFAIGSLPAGSYELSFVAYTLESHRFEIQPGERTYLEITIGAGP